MKLHRYAIAASLAAVFGCATTQAPERTPFDRVSTVETHGRVAPENRPLARERFDVALECQASGDLTPAADRFTQAAAARPRMADAWVHRSAARREGAPVEAPPGFAGAECSNRDFAREDAEQALRVVTEKRHPDAWVARGDARRDSGDLRGAISDYSEAIRIYPHYWIAYVRRGLARFDTGNFKGAAEDFAKRLELKPFDDSREEAALRLWVCRARLAGRAAASAELKSRLKELKGETAEIAAFLVSGRTEIESASGPLSARAMYYVDEARLANR